MLEIFGKEYYVDIDAINEKCNIQARKVLDEETELTDEGAEELEKPVIEINIFKFEIIKMCIERVFAEFNDNDDDDEIFKKTKTPSISFNLAFNTLKKLQIIKINENDDE